MTRVKIYSYNGKCNVSGERIRARREQMQLSQEQLAAKLQLLGLEISQKAVSRVETGLRVVPDYEVRFFASALDTSISQLLGAE